MFQIKSRTLHFYEKHETKFEIAFFLGGYIFDAFMVGEADEPAAIIQQVVYLTLIGLILGIELLSDAGHVKIPSWIQRVWQYRQIPLHFFLGTLLNIYSLFFLKSSSMFSSGIFVLLLLAMILANESRAVKKSKVNIKICWFVVCVFSFFSLIMPVLYGSVGWWPFLTAFGVTALVVLLFYYLVGRGWDNNRNALRTQIIYPSFGVLFLLFVFYHFGLLPPVPLAVEKMGVFHDIKKENGHYVCSHEKPFWKFWQEGDQDFVAEPGDKIYFFATIFSPTHFKDTVLLHWMLKEKSGWKTTDRIPMQLMGGRKSGFRGFAVKEKYQEGDWQVRVETTDEREIGRLYFRVERVSQYNPQRTFQTEIH